MLATDLKGRVFNLNNEYIHWDSADLTSFTGYRRVHLHDASRGQYAVVYSARNGSRRV